jgi:hypothetical protein
VVAVALAASAAACGEESADQDETQGVGPVKAGSVAAGAQCRHWNRGTEEEKLVTIEDIRSQINLESGTVETAGLTDDQAYELFEHACAEDFAAGLKLYKLYVQRAAFQPLAP